MEIQLSLTFMYEVGLRLDPRPAPLGFFQTQTKPYHSQRVDARQAAGRKVQASLKIEVVTCCDDPISRDKTGENL